MHCILYQFHYDLYLKRSSYEFQNKHPTMNNARKSEFFCLKPNLKVHEIRRKVSCLSKVMDISLCTAGM